MEPFFVFDTLEYCVLIVSYDTTYVAPCILAGILNLSLLCQISGVPKLYPEVPLCLWYRKYSKHRI